MHRVKTATSAKYMRPGSKAIQRGYWSIINNGTRIEGMEARLPTQKTAPQETGIFGLLTRPGKLSRRRLEISACVVRFVPDLPADLQLM